MQTDHFNLRAATDKLGRYGSTDGGYLTQFLDGLGESEKVFLEDLKVAE